MEVSHPSELSSLPKRLLPTEIKQIPQGDHIHASGKIFYFVFQRKGLLFHTLNSAASYLVNTMPRIYIASLCDMNTLSSC